MFAYDFIQAFEAYLRKNARTDDGKPLSHNYIHKNLSTLKVILREAYRAGKHTSLAFEAYNIQTKARRGNTAYLTIPELVSLLNTKFPQHLQKYADLLLLSCMTGQRFIDWKGIPDVVKNAKRFGEVDFAPIWNQKTTKSVWIPLLAPVKAILKKYKGSIPTASMKETNLQFKEVCRFAGLNDLVIAPDARGDENPQSETRPKYELVSTKTARTTINTLLRDKGCPDHLIGLITGHYGKKAMTGVYDRRSETERLEQLAPYLMRIEQELTFDAKNVITFF
ncbi:MAG: phage integrase SAM-like domain-containing protein [Haliscomenobacter sp.]|nr:phage integrase SAM-like domain-containing protein [Haliscomenobacter sp.]